jgi:hypothetical protein
MGPIVLSEIMHYPPDLGGTNNVRDEFIELRNITGEQVNLYDPAHTTNTWAISGGVDYHFPQFTAVPANGHILIVGFDPQNDVTALASFRSYYGLTGSETIYGPWDGKLNNTEERITIRRPDTPQQASAENPGFVPMIEVDSVRYGDGSLWMTNANGSGLSLQRLSGSDYSDDPLAWIAATPTAASHNGFDTIDGDSDGMPTVWELLVGLNPNSSTGDDGALGDADLDGVANLLEWRAGTNPNDGGDYLSLTPILSADGSLRVRFVAAPGKRYLLQSTEDLTTGTWVTIDDIPAASRSLTVDLAVPDEAPKSFFRAICPQE